MKVTVTYDMTPQEVKELMTPSFDNNEMIENTVTALYKGWFDVMQDMAKGMSGFPLEKEVK